MSSCDEPRISSDAGTKNGGDCHGSKDWKPRVDVNDSKNAHIVKLVGDVRREVKRRYGNEMTFEQRRDASAEVMAEVLWADTNKDLEELVTDDDEVDIDGVRYRQLEQSSSAVYLNVANDRTVGGSLQPVCGCSGGAILTVIRESAQIAFEV